MFLDRDFGQLLISVFVRFVVPIPMAKVVNPVGVKLQLNRPLRVYPTVHVAWVQPVMQSSLAHFVQAFSYYLVHQWDPVFTVLQLLSFHHHNQDVQYLVDLEGNGPKKKWIEEVDSKNFVYLLLPAPKTHFLGRLFTLPFLIDSIFLVDWIGSFLILELRLTL